MNQSTVTCLMTVIYVILLESHGGQYNQIQGIPINRNRCKINTPIKNLHITGFFPVLEQARQ